MSCVNREQLRKDLLLYAVTDRSWLGEETLYEQVEKALNAVNQQENVINYVINTAAVLNKEPLMHLTQECIKKL